MRWTAGLVLAACAVGCLRDPDPGGQEGEEIRDVNHIGHEEDGGGVDSGTVEDVDTGDMVDGGGDDASVWAGWSGRLRVERGAGDAPGALDCAVEWEMTGTRSELDCAGCDAVFDVEHTRVDADSFGIAACADLPESFSRTYGVVQTAGDTVELVVWDTVASFGPYAVADLVDGALSWQVGAVDVPATDTDGSTLYRTDVEQGAVVVD